MVEVPIVLKESQVKKMLAVMGIEGLRKWALQVYNLHKRSIFVLVENRYPIGIHEYIKKLESREGEKS